MRSGVRTHGDEGDSISAVFNKYWMARGTFRGVEGVMAGMTPEEAENFYEEDEDPTELFAAYDAARENSAKSPVVLEETGGLVRSPDTAGAA